ncbi:MAG: signal peptide peptidase SppA [Tidjanibacter sp.]|nr:signal peptide peptidase SppA [Tidjanibacter sp.]
MKEFFRTFFAVLLALVVVALLPIFIIGGLVGSIEPAAPIVEEDSVLVLNLDESITDSPRTPTFAMGSSSNFEMLSSLTMLEVMEALDAAATDDRIEALYINLSGVGAIEGTAQIEELRALLEEFKATSGKHIVAYNETYTQGGYWISSVADKLYMNPQGGLDWKGLASQSIFFKGAIDKLGVDVQIVRHGTYKSAVEPYMLTEMSPANRRQTEAMVGSIWGAMLNDIASSRKLSPEVLNDYAANLSVDSPMSAVSLGLVDGLRYEDEVKEELRAITGTAELNTITLGEYSSTIVPSKISPNKVAIIYADGEIIDGEGGEGIVGGATTADQIRRAREDKGVKAVVLRVNSPGGSALASEVMWRELKLLGEEKPVVVSMANYAASGGYYISSPADHIVSARTTLTGSIGVFGLIVNAKDVMEQKLGITVDVAKTAPHADMGGMFRPLTNSEMAFMQRSVEDVYGVFLGHVAEGRSMTVEDVDAIGEGRVWCGADAQRIGLVDEFGSLKRALSIAAQKAELGNDWRTVEILEEESEFAALLNTFMSVKGVKGVGKSAVGRELESTLRMIEGGNSIQARMPYNITIF